MSRSYLPEGNPAEFLHPNYDREEFRQAVMLPLRNTESNWSLGMRTEDSYILRMLLCQFLEELTIDDTDFSILPAHELISILHKATDNPEPEPEPETETE